MRRGLELLLLGDEEFEAMVEEALLAPPGRFRAEIGRTVVIDVRPEVTPEAMEGMLVVEDCIRPATPQDLYPYTGVEFFGVYMGSTLLMRAAAPSVCFVPSVIQIFKGPCLRANPDEDALRFQVRNLVEHELGHHFGLDEAAVAAAHRRKKAWERKNPGY